VGSRRNARFVQSEELRTTRTHIRKRAVLLSSSKSQPEAENRNYNEREVGCTFANVSGGQIQKWIVDRLHVLGFDVPTEVQRAAFDVVLNKPRKDAVVHAQTGSGKTLAYLVPLLNSIDLSRSAVQALVVVPTQELGVQVYRLARRISAGYSSVSIDESNDSSGNVPHTEVDFFPEINAHGDEDGESEGEAEASTAQKELEDTELDETSFGEDNAKSRTGSNSSHYVLPLFEQGDLRRQKLQLRHAGPRVLVATPNRLVEVARSGRLQLHTLQFLVVDEFDASLADVETTRALQNVLMASTVSTSLEKQFSGAVVTDATLAPSSIRTPSQDHDEERSSHNRSIPATVAQFRRSQRQTMLVSATVPQHRHFLKQCIAERWTNESVQHVYLSADTPVPERLRHLYLVCDRRKKLSALSAVILKCAPSAALVFVHNSRNVPSIAAKVQRALARKSASSDLEDRSGHNENGGAADRVAFLSEDMSVGDRRSNLAEFREGRAAVMVSTSVAARGLDIPHISHVIHVDLPDSADEYLHRSGRAGRLGRTGDVISICDEGELFLVGRFGNKLGVEFQEATGKRLVEWRLPSNGEILWE